MTVTTSPRRSIGRIVIALLFALLTVNAFMEAFEPEVPPTLRALQALVGVLALATTWGAWSGARWSYAAATAYGFAAGGMVGFRPSGLNRAGRQTELAPLGGGPIGLFGVFGYRQLR